MNNKIMALLAVVLLASPAFAGGEIRDFLAFERQKRVSYSDAVTEFNKSKKPVVVWINYSNLDTWKAVKDDAIHVFVKEFQGMTTGIVIGGDQNGSFVQLKHIATPMGDNKTLADQIKAALPKKTDGPIPSALYTPGVIYGYPGSGGCVNGVCGVRSCPGGNCPRN